MAERWRENPPPGTVVVVNVSQFGCHAVLLDEHGPRGVELTALSLAELADTVEVFLTSLDTALTVRTGAPREAAETGLADALDWLWRAVARDVLDELPDGRRVWWCPTGPFTYLPLHAAGAVPDRTVSSYTPTVGALLRANAASTPGLPGVLGVAVPNAPHAAPLPAAPAELAQLATCLRNVAAVTELADHAATRDAVHAALDEHGWAHLACHGEQNPEQPAQAALLLADGRLRLTEFAARPGYHAEGAYLSACQTAFGGVALNNEALHLAAALQYSGHRRVIGTLWPVPDAIARNVARQIYTTLAADGAFRPHRSAAAVSEATMWARQRYAGSPSCWAAYVHIGP